jgi:hypothetical protein
MRGGHANAARSAGVGEAPRLREIESGGATKTAARGFFASSDAPR